MASEPDHFPFFVDDEPFCVWDPDIQGRNLEFLNSIDSGYFTFMAVAHGEHLEGEDKMRAATATRIAYLHGLETLFTLLAASVQAPQAAYAWVTLCHTGALRSVISRISRGDESLHSEIEPWDRSWQELSRIVLGHAPPEGGWQKDTADEFGKVWAIFAQQLLDASNRAEYNSLKHGFRVRSGGFFMSIGVEPSLGVPAPPEAMRSLGGSNHGSAFFAIEPAGPRQKGNQSRRTRRVTVNWNPETLVRALQVIDMSISNVVSHLKVLNGVAADTVKFHRLAPAESYDAAWRDDVRLRSSRFDHSYPDEVVPFISKDQIRDAITRGMEERAVRQAAAQDTASAPDTPST